MGFLKLWVCACLSKWMSIERSGYIIQILTGYIPQKMFRSYPIWQYEIPTLYIMVKHPSFKFDHGTCIECRLGRWLWPPRQAVETTRAAAIPCPHGRCALARAPLEGPRYTTAYQANWRNNIIHLIRMGDFHCQGYRRLECDCFFGWSKPSGGPLGPFLIYGATRCSRYKSFPFSFQVKLFIQFSEKLSSLGAGHAQRVAAFGVAEFMDHIWSRSISISL